MLFYRMRIRCALHNNINPQALQNRSATLSGQTLGARRDALPHHTIRWRQKVVLKALTDTPVYTDSLILIARMTSCAVLSANSMASALYNQGPDSTRRASRFCHARITPSPVVFDH
jgi:hypothetical protein